MYQVVFLDKGKVEFMEGNEKLSENFAVKEFACKDGDEIIVVTQGIIDIAQKIRDKVGAITISSGFRTLSHNEATPNAAKYSRHMYGDAVDIRTPKGWTDENFLIEVILLLGEEHGFGLYNGRIHVDDRGHKVFWDSRS